MRSSRSRWVGCLLVFATIALPQSSQAQSNDPVEIRGSVLLPYANVLDRSSYRDGGCSHDVIDGRFAAFIDTREFTDFTLYVDGADFIGPVLSIPTLKASLYNDCDPSHDVAVRSCAAFYVPCSLEVLGARFVEIAIANVLQPPYGGVHFIMVATAAPD